MLDTKLWWLGHWGGQSVVAMLSLVGILLILLTNRSGLGRHGVLGYTILLGLLVQVLLGLIRRTRGGRPRQHWMDLVARSVQQGPSET